MLLPRNKPVLTLTDVGEPFSPSFLQYDSASVVAEPPASSSNNLIAGVGNYLIAGAGNYLVAG